MSFNRRGGYDRRPDRPDRGDRPDRPPRRSEGGGDWQPRDRAAGGGGAGDRPYSPRGGGDRPYTPRGGGGGGGGGGDRPYQPRGGAPGGRPYPPRPRFDGPADEGAMSIRLDPRRVGILKQLAADANQRPGDLVRQWVEERIDAQRHGGTDVAPAGGVATRLNELAARIAALEAAAGLSGATATRAEDDPRADVTETATPLGDADEVISSVEAEIQTDEGETHAPTPEPAPVEVSDIALERRTRPATGKRVSAAPSERVALHDEMIAVLSESGPMSAAELAAAVTARGRYAPPRSGKPVDAAMVSQRVSNPTYRSRFTRNQGRIGLAEGPAES